MFNAIVNAQFTRSLASEKVEMNCARIRQLFVGTLQTVANLKIPEAQIAKSSLQGEAKAYGSRKPHLL
jgi:hypothetical protein